MEPNISSQESNSTQPIQQPVIQQVPKQKGFFLPIIAVVLLVLVVGAGVYYIGKNKSSILPVNNNESSAVTSNQKETENWKTYRDPKGRFEFQYPSEFIEVPFKASVQFNKSGAVLEGYTEGNLTLDEFFGRFEQYELVDNPGGFIFRFDTASNQWVHKDGSKSQFVPKKASTPLEVYTHSSGDATCGWDDIIIPNPSNESVILLNNVACGTDEVASNKSAREQRTNRILSSFKFTNLESANTSDWKTYANPTYGYSISFPDRYQVPPQTEIEKSQLGVDRNVCVQKRSDTSCVVVIDTYNSDNLALEDWLNKNQKDQIDGPLVAYNFNSYTSLIVKSHPGIDVWTQKSSYIYHINALSSSSNPEVAEIVATFKLTR